MLITLPPQKLPICSCCFSFCLKLKMKSFRLQLMLPKKDIQESEMRGGKLFRLKAACTYMCVKEKVSQMHSLWTAVFLETNTGASSLALLHPVNPPSHLLFLSGLCLPA